MKAPRTGDLRHRLSIETPIRAGDGGGGATLTWAGLGEVWAAIEPVKGGEHLYAEAISGRVSHEVVVRWRDGLGPELRFRTGPRVFEILAVLDVDERRRFHRCLCREELL